MEKPILFNTEMVRTILEGRKTQTRRIIKQQPTMYDFQNHKSLAFVSPITTNGYKAIGVEHVVKCSSYLKSPYQAGDVLYVRETYADHWLPDGFCKDRYVYKADGTPQIGYYGNDKQAKIDVWIPSIHMPKAAARIFLKVTNVRVEEIRAIAAGDCVKEGIKLDYPITDIYSADEYIEEFKKLWDNCYNWPKSWNANPWVWVIEFDRVD